MKIEVGDHMLVGSKVMRVNHISLSASRRVNLACTHFGLFMYYHEYTYTELQNHIENLTILRITNKDLVLRALYGL